MDGEIWIESVPEQGSKFYFTVVLRRGPEEHRRLLAETVDWSNIRIFVVDDEPEIREFFVALSENLGIFCDVAASGEEAVKLLALENNYDLYFFDWKLPRMNGIELAQRIREKTDNKAIVIIFSSIDWSVIEDDARKAGIDKFLPKPLFQSTIVDLINDCLGSEGAMRQEKKEEEIDNFSGHTILLAEDVAINREIVLALLESTKLEVECAEDGAQALKMFEAAPGKYDMIFMDLQMPEMDGYEATRRIRAIEEKLCSPASGLSRTLKIPIVAMTANVFREDIDRCIEAGMNAHVGKPLDIDEVMVMLKKYIKRR
jgi:CheY-like chemotaxis protein